MTELNTFTWQHTERGRCGERANKRAHLKQIPVTRQLNVISFHIYFPFTVTIRGPNGVAIVQKKKKKIAVLVTSAAETNHTLYNHKTSL